MVHQPHLNSRATNLVHNLPGLHPILLRPKIPQHLPRRTPVQIMGPTLLRHRGWDHVLSHRLLLWILRLLSRELVGECFFE